MADVVVVNEPFERWWSHSAERAEQLWAGPDLHLIRLPPGDQRRLSELDLPVDTERLVLLTHELGLGSDLAFLPELREVATVDAPEPEPAATLAARGVQVYTLRNEGHWGQSVAEFALGLTIGALRRIPQTGRAMSESLDTWSYLPPEGMGRPGARAAQFGDDNNFTSGTIAGKRVRLIGMGNIGARYASFCAALGADVAAWSKSAPDPVFHRSLTRRAFRLPELVADAEIFAPMLPLVTATEGFVTAELVDALPKGCLVVLVTRAQVVDMGRLRERVLADELSLAADVFDIEPLPLDDPLIARHNVVHTPHNAGRTRDANRALVESLLDQFRRPDNASHESRATR